MRITAIVLAAGASERMGTTKQILRYGGSTILGSVLDALFDSLVDEVVVVLGYHAEKVRRAVGDRPVATALNPDPARGMLSSVQCGLAAAKDADAYLVALGDQPQIRSEAINALITAAERSTKSIFVPSYKGRRGHPLLVRFAHRDEILALSQSSGLNALVSANPSAVEEVPVETSEILDDIDTPSDYQRALICARSEEIDKAR